MTQQSTRAGTVGAILRVTSGNFLEQFDFFLFAPISPAPSFRRRASSQR